MEAVISLLSNEVDMDAVDQVTHSVSPPHMSVSVSYYKVTICWLC